MKRKIITRNQLKPWLRKYPLWKARLYTRLLLLMTLPLVVVSPMFSRDSLINILAEWWEFFSARFIEDDNTGS